MSSTTTNDHGTPHGGSRRDFLGLLTGAFAAVGTGAIAWSLIDSMNPAADVIAAGAPMDIDIGKIDPGQQVVVRWRGMPILLVNRTAEMIATLKNPADVKLLADPDSSVDQQPGYARNWHRSVKPEIAVLVGICTHLGCLPEYFPKPDPSQPVANWPGGYFCPCHGSKYDLAGRVWSNVPAPANLPVPPYVFVNDKTLRVGENPPGESFSLGEVSQL
ncbi:MAG: ubiquinol-cytochrome c reductase iron-sulfur subunit [Rhodospirillales bacterium]|nr:ubiquinol-cytochrome c reductase iron-sulfur subunit [Rhodospirillales bacterium]